MGGRGADLDPSLKFMMNLLQYKAFLVFIPIVCLSQYKASFFSPHIGFTSLTHTGANVRLVPRGSERPSDPQTL